MERIQFTYDSNAENILQALGISLERCEELREATQDITVRGNLIGLHAIDILAKISQKVEMTPAEFAFVSYTTITFLELPSMKMLSASLPRESFETYFASEDIDNQIKDILNKGNNGTV